MTNLHFYKIGMLFFVIVSLISCAPQPSPHETWALVKLLSKGDPIDDTETKKVEVRNCIVPEVKTEECSAGTSSNLSIDLGGGMEFGEGVSGSINGSVSSGLGIGRQSGQSISLDPPPVGYIYIYSIEKRFSVIAGEAIAQSQSGNEKTVNYTYQASCSITITAKDQITCGDSKNKPEAQTQPTPILANAQQDQCEWLKTNFPQTAEAAKQAYNLPSDTTFQFVYELCPSVANAFAFKAKSTIELQVPADGCIDSWSGFTKYVGDVGTPVADNSGGWRVFKGAVRAPEMTVRIRGCR